MNTELINKIITHLEEYPEDMDMASWFDNRVLRMGTLWDFFKKLGAGLSVPCETTACIAGWSILLSDDKCQASASYDSGLGVSAIAQKLLDISSEEADILFYRDNWPAHYRRIATKISDAETVLRILRRGLKAGNFAFLLPKG